MRLSSRNTVTATRSPGSRAGDGAVHLDESGRDRHSEFVTLRPDIP
ncbi:MAG TPA: hypothetical protein VMS21_04465 [Methylomirabilota bacterium]|nr:hypothetical protein [Methylomirabilota bacterium]